MLDDAINAILDAESSDDTDDYTNEYVRWKANEPRWSAADFDQQGNPVRYWLNFRSKYPQLSQMAIDIMTIPASSCECERLFSELGDLLEPKRRKIGSQLLAALQCVRRWMKAGFIEPEIKPETRLTDKDLDRLYELCSWEDAAV